MAAQAEILDELRRLRARVPQLTGALASGVDGFVLAQDTPGVEPDRVAALTATVRGVAAQLTDATGHGDFRELLVRGVYGCAATYAAGPFAVLTLLTPDRVNVGRLHLEGRLTGARIAELVGAHVEAPATADGAPPKPTKPTRPDDGPAAETGAPRTRSPRAPRTTAPGARTTTESREERQEPWPTPKPH